jgi:shikimate kinase
VIQKKTGKKLYELIEENGVEGFWKIENDVNASLSPEKTIIATGGSAVYGEEAMRHLGETGTVVYLKISYDELKERLGDLNERGVTLKPGQSLKDLYDERIPLYEKYAGLTIECDGKQLWKIVAEIDTRITK